jgi:hypothetical protein
MCNAEYTLVSKNFDIYNKVISSLVAEVSESSMMQAATGALVEDKIEEGSHILLVLMAAGKTWKIFPEYQIPPLTKGKF